MESATHINRSKRLRRTNRTHACVQSHPYGLNELDIAMDGKTFELQSPSFLDESPAIYGEVCEELTVIHLEQDKPVNVNQQPDVDGKETESCDGMGSVTRFLTSVAAYVASLARCSPRTEDQG